MAPVLAFANFTKPFLLKTDASRDGLGAVLQQKQADGKYHPVAFASWALKGGEKRYHSSKLEFLALKWAVTEQFRENLLYQPFKVRTDNNPLTYIMTTPNLETLGHRWVSALADFQMSIEYMRGADNKVADALICWCSCQGLATSQSCERINWLRSEQHSHGTSWGGQSHLDSWGGSIGSWGSNSVQGLDGQKTGTKTGVHWILDQVTEMGCSNCSQRHDVEITCRQKDSVTVLVR